MPVASKKEEDGESSLLLSDGEAESSSKESPSSSGKKRKTFILCKKLNYRVWSSKSDVACAQHIMLYLAVSIVLA